MIQSARLVVFRGLATLIVLLSVASASAAEKKNALPYNPDFVPLSEYKEWTDINFTSASHPNAAKPLKERYLTIYAGRTSGVYFTVASALCSALRIHFEQHRIHCVALRSQGSSDNRRLMRQGRAQVVIMQSDLSYLAASGKEDIPGARSVMSLYGEMGLLVTRARAGIDTAADLRGKRINLGPDGTIGQELFLDYLSASGIRPVDLARRDRVSVESSPQGLCSGYIDAFAVWSGHPSPLVTEAVGRCEAKVLGLSGPGMEEILRLHPEFSRLSLAANTYPGQDKPLETYGIRAAVLAYEPLDPTIVYWLVRAAVENIDLLRTQHPALQSLNVQEMMSTGNYLPFHPGAVRYWREVGLLPPQLKN